MNTTDQTNQEEKGGNITKQDISSNISKVLEYKIESPEKKEQERTRIKKALFLEYLRKSKGVVSITCEKTEISRNQFYNWIKEDADFARVVQSVELEKNSIAEDILWGMITHEHDGPSLRFYLDRKHPEYKSKLKVEGGMSITPTKSLEELLREDAIEKLNQENDIHGETNTGQNDGQSNADRGVIENTKQTRTTGADEIQPGSGTILEKKDTP